MKARIVILSCDLCPTTATHHGESDPPEWATASFPMSGDPSNVAAICPTCLVRLLDPADDVAADLHRFQLEDRIA